MFDVYKHEMKLYIKTLLIWTACVGGMGFLCILLFSSMQTDMESMAESFASMGAFSDAFGMSQLSIATMTGFYAAEVGTIHSLGGAMFAAIISTVMLSKEEDSHTSEFLFSLPLTRGKIVFSKWCAVLSNIVLFNVLCVTVYMIGFIILGEDMPKKEFLLYHCMQIMMQTELAAVCYAVSAFMKKNKLGLGLGITLLFYAFDLIARVSPEIADYKMISPFSYANASDVLSTGKIPTGAAVLGGIVLIISLCIAYITYQKRDLVS